MKLAFSFPGPVRLDVGLGFALLLMVLQLGTGTSLVFTELTFLAVLFAIFAVNLAGGLKTLAGTCLAIIALKVFVVAELAKALFGEPGQSRLDQPIVTMGVIALSMTSLALAALVCLPLRPGRVLLPPTVDLELLRIIAILCFVFGTGAFFAGQVLGAREDGAIYIGGLAGLLRRVSACSPLAIVAGTAFTLLASGKRRLFGPYNILPFLTEFAVGVVFANKQAMIEPFLYVAATGLAFRFPWRRTHLVGGAFFLFLTLFVLYPFGQVARNYIRGPTLKESINRTVEFLGENLRRPHFLVEQYEQYREGLEEDDMNRYFQKPNGFLERLALIKPTDSLISQTVKEGTSGWGNITAGLADLVPRLILPRPFVNVPNELGYKAGIVLEENFGTCVSFFFAGDAFSSFGWPGVAVVSFAVGLILVAVTRLLVTRFDQNIWAVMLLGAYQNQIAEANFGGVLQTLLYQTAWTVATAFSIRLAAHLVVIIKRRSLLAHGARYSRNGSLEGRAPTGPSQELPERASPGTESSISLRADVSPSVSINA
jgi:hypothetical protein